MSPRILHILDTDAPEDAVHMLSLLLPALSAAGVEQQVAVIGSRPPVLATPTSVPVHHLPASSGLPWTSWRRFERLLRCSRPEVIHAWSARSLTRTSAVWGGRVPLVVTVGSAIEADHVHEWWQTGHSGRFRVVCTSASVQQHLRNKSLMAPRLALLIPPGIEAGERSPQTRRAIRANLDLPATALVLTTASPPSRAGGQFHAVWAAAILRQFRPDVYLVVPGCSKEQARIRRLIHTIYCPEVFTLLGNRLSPAEILVLADLLVFPATGDVGSLWPAWAMAAGVPVFASAIAPMKELIADQRTGFLSPPSKPHALATLIREALESPELLRSCAAAARAQALRRHDPRQCTDSHLALYCHLATCGETPLRLPLERC